MTSRAKVEQLGRASAGIKAETDSAYLVNVLSMYDMYVNKLDGSVAPCLVRDGYWESWITSWVMSQNLENTIFIDVGANCGYYSFLAASLGCEVYAFEPNPLYSELIQESSRVNGLEVKVFNSALSDNVGKATLSVPDVFQGSATIVDIDLSAYNPMQIEVSTIPLDAIEKPINKKLIIKIDAEGAEEMIWDGMQKTLSEHRPTVALEYTPGAYGRDFLNKLESYGNLKWINFDGLAEPVTKDQIISQGDWLMLVIEAR